MNYTIAGKALVGVLGLALLAGCSEEPSTSTQIANDAAQTASHNHEPGHQHGGHQGSATSTTVKVGKYEVNLRVPEEGLHAGEEIDVEFRVTDTTQKDPIEEGFKGVPNVEAKGVVTMPSMPGMPEQKPEIHREGVPGDYGIVLFFPHGGEYQIALDLTPPGEKAFKATFKVSVSDEPQESALKTQPYTLNVVNWPADAKAGTTTDLKLQVKDTKTGSTQKSFDVSHEMKFHLLIASKDLNWFTHEHPTMADDGTWSIPINFPAGGEYWIYGDVAPTGKGARVLITKVKVAGNPPSWDQTLKVSSVSTDGGLKGELKTLENPIPIGKMATLEVRLTNEATGKPAGDTVKWLGAAGHMMIFHEDGQTVVHSHPAEDKENEGLVKSGIVRFTGRFPKPGLYKVYAQFDWNGAIRTLGFGIEVKE